MNLKKFPYFRPNGTPTLRVAVVGNAACEIDYSCVIDASDVVVRFNECRSKAFGTVGSRTDILCIAASPEHRGKFAKDGRIKEAFEGATTLWCSMAAHPVAGATVRYLNNAFGTNRKAAHVIAPNPACPESSGSAVIRHLIGQKDLIVDVYGFGFQGWSGHDWARERAQASVWESEGRITIYPLSENGGSSGFGELTIAPVYFNPAGAAVWERMLEDWLEHYHNSKNSFPVKVVTDAATQLPKGVDCLRIADDPEFCRSPLNKAGWLKMHAAKVLAPCVVFDIDATVRGSLGWLGSRRTRLGMCEDPAKRMHARWPEASPEANSGVLLVKDASVAEIFKRIWRERYQGYCSIPMFEELVWTAVWREVSGELLPRVFNWSHWWKESASAVVFHRHGQAKLSEGVEVKSAS
jgi:hypothetical protein